ncbi:hypothetical protein AB4Z55_25270 [Gordonia sp. ABKF26]|uniref:hypothetical protein n=1 Tax=Gordonia sp. ABKF26 TaxID=3238687 RepID=UPI0034E5D85E
MTVTIVLFISAAVFFVVATVRREHQVDPRGEATSDRVSRLVLAASLSTSAIACASALLYMVDRT